MSSESANGVATFLRFSRPMNFSPLHMSTAVQTTHLSPVLANRNFQLVAFSTGLIGTGLALSAFYPGFFNINAGHHQYNPMANDSFIPVRWLEYPADYAPPVMDPFVDDQVPFGVSSSLSCLKDSEHLEKAFDLLRYQHLSKKLGVPSALNQRTPIRRLRILGNSSSGSPFEFLAVAAKLAHFIQSGSREIYGGSKGSTRGEKNADVESSSPHAIATNSTRLPLVFGDNELKGEPVSHWTGIIAASLIVAITVVGLLARTQRPLSSLCMTPEEAGSNNPNDGNVYCKDCCKDFPPVPFKEPSLVLSLGFLINPEYWQSVEQLFEDDPLAGTYIPFVVLKFLDIYNPCDIDAGMQGAYETIVMAMITPQPSCSTSSSSSATLVNETVETLLAPVVDKEDTDDLTERCKGKAAEIFETDAKPVSKSPKRVRGRRGHGRGRRPPTVPDDA